MKNLLILAVLGLALAGCGKKDTPTAAEVLEREASRPPGAPTQTQSNQSADPLSASINAGERTKATLAQSTLKSVVEVFKVQESRNPASLQELVEMKYINSLPPMPVGFSLSYNPATGEVLVQETPGAPGAPATTPAPEAQTASPVETPQPSLPSPPPAPVQP